MQSLLYLKIRCRGQGFRGPHSGYGGGLNVLSGEDQHILGWLKEVPRQTVNVSVRNAGFHGVAPPSDEHLSGVE
jgi:hypothetical protein